MAVGSADVVVGTRKTWLSNSVERNEAAKKSKRSPKNVSNCMYVATAASIRASIRRIFCPGFFAVYAGVGKLFFAVVANKKGILRYNSSYALTL